MFIESKLVKINLNLKKHKNLNFAENFFLYYLFVILKMHYIQAKRKLNLLANFIVFLNIFIFTCLK